MSPELEYAYELLEVTPDVSDKEMRSAWRKLVRRYHPDLSRTDPEEASRRMADINAAFDALALHRAKEEEASTAEDRTEAKQAQRRSEAPKAQTTERSKKDTPREEHKPRDTALKTTTQWSREEQSLVNAASSLFEETRRKLGEAARRPMFSVCH